MSQRKSSLAAELRPEWLRDIDARLGAARAVTGGQASVLTPHALSDTSIHTGTLLPAQAPWALTNSISILAGNGLIGGGVLTNDVGLAVGAGTLITVTGDSVNLANGTAQYQVPVTGASPFTPAWTGLSGFAGNGLSFTGGQFAVGAGTLISVSSTTVGIAAGANYQFIGTGGGTAAVWRNVSELAGNGLTATNGVLAVGAGDGITVSSTAVALTTPGGLSATTTNSAAGNHTHAIATAAAVGLSATTTNAAGTSASLARADHTHAIATGSATTLNVSSTNTTGSSSNLARADHTHAITSSSNPGAAASLLATNSSGYLQLVRLGLGMSPTRPLDVSGDAGVSGQIIAGSGAISGALTVGGDFTVGANVLYVNQAGTRVGINRAPDQQFDLDVAGAIRGQYLVGKHAIQLASAVGVWHFDGPAPFNLDFTGSNASHMGVGGTAAGGVIYRPGKFGKAVQIAEATTNYVTNPGFELQSLGEWSAFNSPTISYSTDARSGDYALSMQTGATSNPYIYRTNAPITLAVGQAWTLSAYVKAGNASASGKTFQITLRENANDSYQTTASITLTRDWQRVVVTRTLSLSDVTTLDRLIRLNSSANSGDIVLIDDIQLENKPYATPHCDGSLGSNHNWNGTPHASTSSRTGATLTYDNNAGLNPDEGTIMMWARHAGMATNVMGLWATGSNAQFDAYVNQVGSIYFRQSNTNQSFGAGIQPQTWNHYAFTWSKSANTRKIFVNGVERSSRQFDAGATIGSTLFVGSLTAGAAYGTNGEIDEFILLDYAADPKLIRAIYESDAPVFVESSVFHWRSPSRVPIWVDEFGLWARGVSGNEILGLYGGDPRNPTGNVTRSWGGITMEENDVVIGRAAQAAVHWDDSAGTMLIGRPSAANMLLSGGALRIRNGTTDKIVLDSGGNASFTGAITALAGSIAGVLTIGTSGEIRQGTGTLGTDYTGLRVWRDSGIGRIGGYASNVLQWYAGTDGKLYAGGGNVAMSASGIAIAPNYDSTSLTFTNVGEFYALYSAGFGGTLCLRAGYNRPKESNLLLEAYSGTTVKSSLQLGANGIISAVGALGMTKTTAPSAPAPDGAYLYLDDNGSGKTRLMVRFGSGSAIQLAIQP